jgi:hypothetical protein
MPAGSRKLTIRFGAVNITPYGGVLSPACIGFFHASASRVAVARQIQLVKRNNRILEMLLALLYPMIRGLRRVETTQLLRQNGVFQELTGLGCRVIQRLQRRLAVLAARCPQSSSEVARFRFAFFSVQQMGINSTASARG